MKRIVPIVCAVMCCAAIVALSTTKNSTRASKPVNPYVERYLKTVEACERNNQEWQDAEDQAGEKAWTKYGERWGRTEIGLKDCNVEAWNRVDRLPYPERLEARRQVEIALKGKN